MNPDCPSPQEQYESRRQLKDHAKKNHSDLGLDLEGEACPFCHASAFGITTLHVGRHMEEIAFAVVTKPYEEWDFYTDSSSNVSQDQLFQNIERQFTVSSKSLKR